MIETHQTPHGPMLNLYIRSFRHWLEQKQSQKRPAGFTNQCHWCPIALWLHEVYHIDGRVYGHCLFRIEGQCLLLPPWVHRFVQAIDAHTQGLCQPISAQQTLALLRLQTSSEI